MSGTGSTHTLKLNRFSLGIREHGIRERAFMVINFTGNAMVDLVFISYMTLSGVYLKVVHL